METQLAKTPEVEVSAIKDALAARIEQYAAAIRAKDLERVMSIFSPGLVSFDLEAPLQHVGAGAKRRNWARAFAAYDGPLDYQITGLSISVSECGFCSCAEPDQWHIEERQKE